MSPDGAIAGQARERRFFDSFVFFTWWVTIQQRVESWSGKARVRLIGAAIFVGVMSRLWAQTRPSNWDFQQWINVSDAALSGVDPYATYGYNYPPPWLATLTLFNSVTGSETAFRLLIALLLTVADIGILLLLARRGYTLAGVLFMLSPITIAISGQHHQVEGIAVVLALGAVTLLSGPDTERVGRREWVAVVLLGLSLAFKPVFLVFPLWLALRPGSPLRRLFVLAAPIVVFGLIFVSAFLVYPADVVLQKVLGHGGANNSPFINEFVPAQLAPWVLEHGGGKIVFVLILVGTAWLFRHLPPFELALAYTMTAVVFSFAMVNQYLVTPMAAVAVFLNLGLLVWLGLASLYLMGAKSLEIPGLTFIQQNTLLEWERVMQDLFPWILIGWILFVIALRDPRRHMSPGSTASRSPASGAGPSGPSSVPEPAGSTK